MNEVENNHSQQANTGTENQTIYILTHRLNNGNSWTQGGKHHTLGSVGGCWGKDSRGWKDWDGITWGEMPDISEGGIEAANHIVIYVPMQQYCMICTRTPEPKVQYKKVLIIIA